MYSNSNSFMGGNTLRPGPQQYGNSFGMGAGGPGQQPQQPGQQPSPFTPQPTGYGQAPLNQQYTGFPGGQGIQPQSTGMPQQSPMVVNLQQPQYTGFSGQAPQQQSYQTGLPPVPQIPSQFQSQFNQQPQPQPQNSFSSPTAQAPSSAPAPAPAPAINAQPTGFSAMAASFKTGGASESQPRGRRAAQKPANKIPNIRLSFITAQDQAKFETLFKSAVGDGQMTMSGDKARDLLLRSRLDGDSLSHIWYGITALLSCKQVSNLHAIGLSQTLPDRANFTSQNSR